VEAFKRSLGGPVPTDPVRAAMKDRAALAALLGAAGLPERFAHDVAEEGLALLPGEGRSHFGAPALLPAGEAWPEGLTFLAGIDLAEAGRGTGWMLFFADVDGFGYKGEDQNRPGSTIRMFACDAPVEADGPCLGSRALAFEPVLMLPGWYSAAEELGLDAAAGEAYDELDSRMHHEWPGHNEGTHWFGGLYTGIQSQPPEPRDSVLLLHVEWDEELGFLYGDLGSIQFRIPRDALAAGDWSQVTAIGCSG
jgi:hypothetical protein